MIRCTTIQVLLTLLIIITALSTSTFACPPRLQYFSRGKSIDNKDAAFSRSLISPQDQDIDSKREKLLTTSLGLMTLRSNGKLATETELQPFMDHIRSKYLTSNFYKTFVIAFQHGVLPKLTLKEGDACNPRYIGSYRDPANYSVTYHYQKKFIFDNFNNRTNFTAYCDYRLGLVCNPNSKKCACPLGAKMVLEDPSHKEKRCLLQEGETCALIDLSHSLKHEVLMERLPHLIFNLEKPLGCKHGTQCRFKDLAFPKCYANNAGPFKTYQGDESLNKKYGKACTLNLIAQPGMCEAKPQITGGLNGYVCYNYWGRDGYFNRTGFCANEYGPFAEVLDDAYSLEEVKARQFFGYFVNPKTTPLRGQKIEEYQNKLIQVYRQYLLSKHLLQWDENKQCSVQYTDDMIALYKFYAALPTTGSDEKTLQEKLKKALDLTDAGNAHGRQICNVFWRFYWEDGDIGEVQAMTCKSNGNSNGRNDGLCEAGGEVGKAVKKVFSENIDRLLDINKQLTQEAESYDKNILKMYPEVVESKPKPPKPSNSRKPITGKDAPEPESSESSGSGTPGQPNANYWIPLIVTIISFTQFCTLHALLCNE